MFIPAWSRGHHIQAVAILTPSLLPELTLMTDRDVEKINGLFDNSRWFIILSRKSLYRIRTADTDIRSDRGLFVLMPPYDSAQMDFYGTFQGYALAIDSTLNATLEVNNDMGFRSAVHNQPYVRIEEEQTLRLSRFFMLLEASMTDESTGFSHMEQIHLCAALIKSIQRYYYFYDQKLTSFSSRSISEDFMNLVTAYCETERKLEFYAGKLGLSKKYLSAIVSSSTGKTASHWIEEQTILKAKHLLQVRNLTIKEVSDQMKFHQCSDFSKYFRRSVGMTPKEYRRLFFKG